jgi:hypothetical protein
MSNVSPLDNYTSKYANIDNLGLFTSKNNSYSYGNPQIVNNSHASRYSGGRRKRRRKSKKRISLYKKKRRTLRRRYKINQNGGVLTSVTNCNYGYSTGGVNIPSNLSALANPVIAIPNGNSN